MDEKVREYALEWGVAGQCLGSQWGGCSVLGEMLKRKEYLLPAASRRRMEKCTCCKFFFFCFTWILIFVQTCTCSLQFLLTIYIFTHAKLTFCNHIHAKVSFICNVLNYLIAIKNLFCLPLVWLKLTSRRATTSWPHIFHYYEVE